MLRPIKPQEFPACAISGCKHMDWGVCAGNDCYLYDNVCGNCVNGQHDGCSGQYIKTGKCLCTCHGLNPHIHGPFPGVTDIPTPKLISKEETCQCSGRYLFGYPGEQPSEGCLIHLL